MAEFLPAYQVIKKHEGGYVSNPLDPGGETYMGIARKKFPSWAGWPLVDAYKATVSVIPTNSFIPNEALTKSVQAFFKSEFWDNYQLSEIIDQFTANHVMDILVNHGFTSGSRIVQNALVDLGRPVTVDGVLGPRTRQAINDSTAASGAYRTNGAIVLRRQAFYNYLVQRNPSLSVFLKGWLKRASSFLSENAPRIGLALLLLGIITYLGIRSK